MLSTYILHSQGRNFTANTMATSFFVQNISIPIGSDSMRVLLTYSVCYDAVLFSKSMDGRYFGIPEIEVSYKDKDGITRKRYLSQDTIWTDDFEQTTNKRKYYKNVVEFMLLNGDYKMLATLSNSKIPRGSKVEGVLSPYQPFYLNIYGDNTDAYEFFNTSGTIPFSAPSFTFFAPDTSTHTDIHYRISKENSKSDLDFFIALSGDCKALTADVVPTKEDNDIILRFHTSTTKLLTFALPMNTFSIGDYNLELRSASNEIIYNYKFTISWNEKPRSLMDANNALEEMYLILTDDEYKEMRRGDVKRNIEIFWKEHNPKPEFLYNEAMATYFRRCDEAQTLYQTITQSVGSKSDRGKVYKLYGKPDSVTTAMGDKNMQEIWEYNVPQKRFVFEIISAGNYVLVSE